MSSHSMAKPRQPALLPFKLEFALFGILMAVVVFGLALAVFTLGYQVVYTGRIFPGVTVGGVSLGGLSIADAESKLNSTLTYPYTGRLVLQNGDQSWLVSPAQLGVILDSGSSARAAYQIGRNGRFFNRLDIQMAARQDQINLSPVLVFDQRTAFLYLNQLAAEIDTPMQEPQISIINTVVSITPGSIGHTLDYEASLHNISTQAATLQDGIIPLVVRETSPVIINVEEQAELARKLLSEPLSLKMPANQPDSQGPWTFTPDNLGKMLAFEVVQIDGTSQYQVTIKTELLRDFLRRLHPDLYLNPENTRFMFNDGTGQLEVIKNATIGRELDVEESIKAIHAQLVAGGHEAELVFDFTEPEVTDSMNGEQLGITELVHAETSYFYGSDAARIQNIQASASQFHGLLIAPGQTFSMASALGDISLDNGYAEALIIFGNQTIKGVGGGVCQVSTTLFRAAFFAGFPINERYAHAYRVSYYERVAGGSINPDLAGLDATVYAPVVDLKFTNDTPYWLLMETYVYPGSSSITWKFYSTSDGRSVEWNTTGPINIVEAPKPLYRENSELSQGDVRQVDWAAQGADVSVNRTVYKDGAVYFQDSFFTHYQPWQAVYEYGPGTPDMPPPED
ncbi:MAG TPA: VanW family protein [Anaerolineaceae bacterium]|nr:VanW family protein [Anaerolineaceae bacterium]